MVRVHGPVPEQEPPLQPVKVEPIVEDAVRVTVESFSKGLEQVSPQEMPGGLLVMVP